ncbi:outer membrane beta-barrel protein [Dyella koreensis]|uniref:Outer membrane beta-barrel protein n=1 Tax=Dyella koreensis TaxID=311235 RepID=A0ABW8K3G5_9GAMM
MSAYRERNKPAHSTLARAIALALLVTTGAASAAQFDYALYAGIEHSDNITLSTNNPVSQNVFIPGVNFTYSQLGSTVQAKVAGSLEYRDYLGNTFDNQTQGQLAAQANWTVMPQRLDLSVEDYAGIQPVDSLASNAPNNQQQTNVLSVGPILHFRMGDAMRGQAEVRYVNSYASKVKDFNSSRGVGAFRLFRDLSPTAQISANLEYQHVDFNQSLSGPNYDRIEGYARYTSKLAHFTTDVSLGYSRLKFKQGAGSDSAPLVRLALGWQPNLHNEVILSGSYQYADAAQDIAQQPYQPFLDQNQPVAATLQGVSVGNVVVSSQVYLERRLDLSYAYRGERFSAGVTPGYRRLGYINNRTLNQAGRSLGFNAEYRLRPTLTLSGFAYGEKLDYSTLNRTDKTYRYGLDLAHQWTPHWSWHASVTYQRRNSDAVNQSYHETAFFLGVVYRR